MRLVTPSPSHEAALGRSATHAVLEDERLVGGLSVVPTRPGAVELSFWVMPSCRRRGVAVRAVRELCRTVSSRVELVTEITDTVPQRVALNAGFTREAVRRGGTLRSGTRHDDVLWAWLPGDSHGPAPRPLPDLPGGALRDGSVSLRPQGPDDVDDLLALKNTPDVRARALLWHVRSREEVARECRHAASAWLAGERAQFVIEVDGAFAGSLGLFPEPYGSQAMIGYSMLPAFRGRGTATRAVRLVGRWALEIGVRRLVAGTAPDNVASQRVLEKAGFVREGVERARFDAPDGGRADDVVHVLLPG